MKYAAKFVGGITENVIVVDDFIPEGYEIVAFVPGVGQAREEAYKNNLNIVNENLRKEAYIAEADPLFFKAQRGEATLDEWQAKVEEIKQLFPYQE
jgi:hypothetical protein